MRPYSTGTTPIATVYIPSIIMHMHVLMVMNLNKDIIRTLTPVGWRRTSAMGKLLVTSHLWTLVFSQAHRLPSLPDENGCELGYWTDNVGA